MEIQKNIPVKDYCTFRVGGNADFFVKVHTKEELLEAIKFSKKKDIPILFLGGGSNILFNDGGFRGMVIKIENTEITPDFNRGIFNVGAGVMNIELYRYAKEKGYDFSPLYTVPGTLGGALVGNAGIPDGEIKDFFLEAEVFNIGFPPDKGEVKGVLQSENFETKSADFFDLSYRHSIFHKKPELKRTLIIWNLILKLPKETPEKIEEKAKAVLTARKERQPWGKTGGSFFKNPKKGAAGYFLDQCRMKEQKVGGAFFSEKHANFMMNDGTATQKDILHLARIGQRKVQEKFEVTLVPEVRIIDQYGKEIHL